MSDKAWLHELTAVGDLRERAWGRIAGRIAIRRQDMQAQLNHLVKLAHDATMGMDVVDQMRETYINLQTYARILCQTAMGYRDAHRELGSLKPAAVVGGEEAAIPLVKVRWMDEPLRRRS